MSLFDRIATASAHPRRWRTLTPPIPLHPRGDSDGAWGLEVEIDDAGPLPGFLQIARHMPLRFGLRIPGAPGREQLADLLRLLPPRRPPSAEAWARAMPAFLAQATGAEAAQRLALARALVDREILRLRRGGIRWRTLGPRVFLAGTPDDPHPLEARGGTLPLPPPLRPLLANVLLPTPDVRPLCWGDACDALAGHAPAPSAHALLAFETRIAEQAHALLGRRAAQRLLTRTRR
jgi:hypothetical protein